MRTNSFGTFLGIPMNDPKDDTTYDVGILGVPYGGGATGKTGAHEAPDAIRQGCYLPYNGSRPAIDHNFVDPLLDLHVVDYGNVVIPYGDTRGMMNVVRSEVREVLKTTNRIVVLGGDHSISHGTISGLVEAHSQAMSDDLVVIHFDAHADTGEIHGGELTHGTPMRFLIENGIVQAENFYQIGLRGFWPSAAEFEWMEKKGMTSYTMNHIRQTGLDAIVDSLIMKVRDRPVWLSIDIDVCDPAFAPGTGTAEPGGLTSQELLWSVYRMSERLQVLGAEVVEFLPANDPSGITAVLTNRLVLEVIGGFAYRQMRITRQEVEAVL